MVILEGGYNVVLLQGMVIFGWDHVSQEGLVAVGQVHLDALVGQSGWVHQYA